MLKEIAKEILAPQVLSELVERPREGGVVAVPDDWFFVWVYHRILEIRLTGPAVPISNTTFSSVTMGTRVHGAPP